MCSSIEEKRSYWTSRLNEMKEKSQKIFEIEGKVDFTTEGLINLLSLAISLDQYEIPTSYNYEPSKKVLKVKTKTPRYVFDKILCLETVGVYGVGLFTAVEGIILPRSFRSSSNFDLIGKKGVIYDLSSLPEDVRANYEFGLSIPAFDGIFVPKKSEFTTWITRPYQLEFFDITI